MSNELVIECLKHKDNRNIQTRLDYMLLYRNETKAKVIRIMETWTNTKRAEWYKLYVESKEQGIELPEEPPKEALWVTMSYEEFSIYAYGTMNHDNIKRNVDALVEHGHLKRRPHPDFPYGAPQYLLDTENLQGLLDEQEIPSLFEDIGKIRPPRKKHTPPEKNPQGGGINTPRDGVNLPPGWGGKYPPTRGENTPPSNNYSSKNHLELPKREGRAEITDLQEVRKRITNGRLKVCISDSHERLSESGEDDTPTEKMKAVKPLQQKLGEGAPLPPVAVTPLGSRGDGTPVQASPVCVDAGPQSVPPGGAAPASGLRITHAPVSKPLVQDRLSMKESAPVVKLETPAQIQRRLERRRDEYLAIYGQEIGRKPSRSRDNLDGCMMCAVDEVAEEDFRTTIKRILADDFLAKNLSVSFVYKKLDALAKKSPPGTHNGTSPSAPRRVNFTEQRRLEQQQQQRGVM